MIRNNKGKMLGQILVVIFLLLTGGSIGIFIDRLVSPSNITEIKVFQREGKPSVMRIYKPGRDEVFVEDKEMERYIRLEKHLNKIQNKAEREIEEALIKKTAEWYK